MGIRRLHVSAGLSAIAVGGLLAVGACSTAKVAPMPELPEPPSYTRVRHPDSPDLGDIRAVFAAEGAPPAERLKECDKDFQKLRGLVQSGDELKTGAREFVGMFPEDYHWCFYWQFVQLEEKLKELVYHDERQAEVVRVYAFLAPIAQAFKDHYKDTRYLRSAAYQYKNVSQRVFLRKLALTPSGAQNLFVGAATEPNALWQQFKPGDTPVLEKYGFAAPTQQALVAPPAPAGAPASASAAVEPVPAPEPVAAEAPPAEPADPNVWAGAGESAPPAPVADPAELP